MKFKLLVVLLLCFPFRSWAQFSVSGYIYDAKDKESLPSATIQDTTSKYGVSSNSYGFFSINVDTEIVVLRFSYVGYETKLLQIDARSNELLEIVLEEKITETLASGASQAERRQTVTREISALNLGVGLIINL